MDDQAAGLRGKISRRAKQHYSDRGKRAEVKAVVSGKGGVGKSNFTINFAIGLQQAGKKVLVIDLDIGMANIDILLGTSTDRSIVDMLEGHLSIWSIMEGGPHGLSYIAGGSGLNELFQMDDQKANHFYQQLEAIETVFDYIFLDMGAGANGNSSHFLFASHDVILVTTPEPTAITDAYAMVKYIYNNDAGLPVQLVVNRARSKKDGRQTADNVVKVTDQFLAKTITELTVIPDDQTVWKAVRAQTPFLLYAPQSKPSQAIINAVQHYSQAKVPQHENSADSFLHKLRSLIKSHEPKR